MTDTYFHFQLLERKAKKLRADIELGNETEKNQHQVTSMLDSVNNSLVWRVALNLFKTWRV